MSTRALGAPGRRSNLFAILLGIASLALLAAPAARASFHLMQVEQIIGGVDGDVTAQAIQLRMRAEGQSYLNTDDGGTHGPAGLVISDAGGLNPVTLITFPHDVSHEAAGSTILITSPNFLSHVVSASTSKPDYTLTAIIPESYLAAGRLDYIDGQGNVVWSFSYGGDKYTGALAAANFNGTFGTPFEGSLPTAGTEAVKFQGVFTAASASNATDYAETASGTVFTNNAGANFNLPGDASSTAQVSIKTTRSPVSADKKKKALLLVTRTGDTAAALTVNYKVGGSATAGLQYKKLSGSLTIPAGNESAKIKVAPRDDGLVEGTKSVKVTLLPGVGYGVDAASKRAKVKISGDN